MSNYITDWLSSVPVFYNTKNNNISYDINDVIDYKNIELDPDGLINYLDFGYSVFGQTPIKNVKFLEPNCEITIKNKSLCIKKLKDPVEEYIDKEYSVDCTLNTIKTKINNWENNSKGKIIIPTSGGYDSRLLNLMISSKDRIRAYSYGVSENQSNSSEVIIAQQIARQMGIKWKHIELGNYHKYLSEWINIYGCSVHAHGMYQMEFYKKIIENGDGQSNLLSGIIGDAWAGSVVIDEIKKYEDVDFLSYSHGLKADSSALLIKGNENVLKRNYYIENKNKLENKRWRVVESMRRKIILLRYLIEVPKKLGFKPWSPFLDIEVAMKMLCLPDEKRIKRNWETEYFKRNSIFYRNTLNMDRSNVLNVIANKKNPLEKLDEKILSKYFNKNYIFWINKQIERFHKRNTVEYINDCFLKNYYINGIINKVGLSGYYKNELEGYYAYLVVKPIENILKIR